MYRYSPARNEAMDVLDEVFQELRQRLTMYRYSPARKKLFDELHYYHAHTWMRSPTINRGATSDDVMRYHRWRQEWWKLLEKEFPEFIKDGVAICTSRYPFRPDTTSSPPIGSPRTAAPILP